MRTTSFNIEFLMVETSAGSATTIGRLLIAIPREVHAPFYHVNVIWVEVGRRASHK